MENKLILVAVIWLSGLVAGVILVARWLRMGERQVATATSAPVVEEPTTTSGNKVQRTAQRLAGPVMAGAKADLLTVRNATRKFTHRDEHTVNVSETASIN